MSELDERLKRLADRYGIYTKEEFWKAFKEMERIDIGIFVTPVEKENRVMREGSNSSLGEVRNSRRVGSQI